MAFAYSRLGERVGPPSITRLMALALENPQVLSLAAGFTDNGTLPVKGLADSIPALLDREPGVLQYGTNAGREDLRQSIASWIEGMDGSPKGTVDPHEIQMTNGSQQALFNAISLLADPGDCLIVDSPTYFVFLEMLQHLGIRALPLPNNDRGEWDKDMLHKAFSEWEKEGLLAKARGVYFMGYYGNPTGRSRTLAEKQTLAEALLNWVPGIPVLEDAAYRPLGFHPGSDVPGAPAIHAFHDFPIIYLGTLTKAFATGLKVGFHWTNDSGLRSKMAHLKGSQDFGTSHFNQAILAEAFRKDFPEPFLETLRKTYRRKMEILLDTLGQGQIRKQGWSFDIPAGGLYFWLKGPPSVDTRLDGGFFKTCLQEGVFYIPGDLCFPENPPTNTIRLSFGYLREDLLPEAGRRFCKAVNKISHSPVLP